MSIENSLTAQSLLNIIAPTTGDVEVALDGGLLSTTESTHDFLSLLNDTGAEMSGECLACTESTSDIINEFVHAHTPDNADESLPALMINNGTLKNAPELIADTPKIIEEAKMLSATSSDSLADTIALNQQAFDEILKPLSRAGLAIENFKLKDLSDQPLEVSKAQTLNQKDLLETSVNKLEALLSYIDSIPPQHSEQLITTDLTPAQITELKLYAEQTAHDDIKLSQALSNIADKLSVLNLAPVSTDGVTTQERIIHTRASSDTPLESLVFKDILSAEKTSTTNSFMDVLTAKPKSNAPYTKDSGSRFENIPAPTVSKNYGDASTHNTPVKNNNGQSFNNNVSALKGWPLSTDGSLLASMESTSQFISSNNAFAQTTNINGLQTLTNMVTQPQSAGSAHPGTQLVAATIQKYSNSGKETKINLQLDPPELGRVEVRMSFDKNKNVKAAILVEKPETMLMLQRDISVLERSLQEAGLDTNDNALSFELAQDDHNFNHNGGHDGSRHNTSKSNTDNEENIEIINSTMSWQVDPQTGHTHYNIMV